MRASTCLVVALLGGVVCSVTAAPARPEVAQWRFRAYLDNAPVGEHRFSVRRDGAHWSVDSDARFDVTLLGVPVFRYRHHSTEQWQSGCLDALDAATDENGRRRKVAATPDGDHLLVTASTRAPQELAGCVMTYAYWNPALLQATHLLNAQTGENQLVRITRLGAEAFSVHGRQVSAQRYRLDTGKHDIDLWYSPDGQWLGLESTIVLGKRLRYVLE